MTEQTLIQVDENLYIDRDGNYYSIVGNQIEQIKVNIDIDWK